MIKKSYPLNNICTYRTGGKAEYYSRVRTDAELKDALSFAHKNKLEIIILGGGYNVLIHDKGVKGMVINTAGLNVYIIRDGETVYAGAGVSIDSLAEWACENGLRGLEDMSGIPGTVGGAVKMNAGAFTQEIKDTAAEIDMMSTDGRIYQAKGADAGFGYRRADNLKGVVLGAKFHLKNADSEELKKRRSEILAKRTDKQPLDYPSCGSVFKRPEGNFAGTLIEQCGLKGYRIGGAIVSEKHANFILNIENATSSDIYNLICHVRETVKEKTGITLEQEVRLIGF